MFFNSTAIRLLSPAYFATLILGSLLIIDNAHAWTPSGVGNAPDEFLHGSGTSTSTTVAGHLPEDVPPPTTQTQQGRMDCFREGNSDLLGKVCLYVDWTAYTGGYQHGTGIVIPADTNEVNHPYGYDRNGNFRQSDTFEGLWYEEIGGWRQVAGFGDYIDNDGRLCGCFRALRGCFAPGVKITMADDTEKLVEDLSAGDQVWNPVTKQPVRIKRIIEGPEAKPLIELGYAGHTLHVTTEHPILVQANAQDAKLHTAAFNSSAEEGRASPNDYKKASELKLGDQIRGADGQFHAITIYRQLPLEPGQLVINFELEGSGDGMEQHMLLSDGIVSGDLRAQWNLGNVVAP